MRDLIESTGIPFHTANYAQRAAIFRQGDSSDSVMHIAGAFLIKKIGFIEDEGGVLYVHPSRLHAVQESCRGLSSSASAVMPQGVHVSGDPSASEGMNDEARFWN